MTRINLKYAIHSQKVGLYCDWFFCFLMIFSELLELRVNVKSLETLTSSRSNAVLKYPSYFGRKKLF